MAQSCSIAPSAPAVIFGRDIVLSDPTPDKLARLLGLNLDFKTGRASTTRGARPCADSVALEVVDRSRTLGLCREELITQGDYQGEGFVGSFLRLTGRGFGVADYLECQHRVGWEPGRMSEEGGQKYPSAKVSKSHRVIPGI